MKISTKSLAHLCFCLTFSIVKLSCSLWRTHKPGDSHTQGVPEKDHNKGQWTTRRSDVSNLLSFCNSDFLGVLDDVISPDVSEFVVMDLSLEDLSGLHNLGGFTIGRTSQVLSGAALKWNTKVRCSELKR